MEGLGTQASTLDIAKIMDIKLPPPAEDGRIPTMNKSGFMTLTNDQISQLFIEYSSSKPNMTVFDGGAAYGITTIAALKKGATVISNDSCKEHLYYIVKNPQITDDDRKRLYIYPGLLPNEVDLPDNSIDALHLSRMMHFLQPEEIEEMFMKAKKWLKDKGLFFIIIMSPWHHSSDSKFHNEYEKNFKEGIQWPGEIKGWTTTSGQSFKDTCPPYLHAIDPKVMMRLATKYDFTVKRLQLYGGPNDEDYTGAILINNK